MTNGSVWLDTDGNEIWCNGGHMVREAGVTWWVGYDTGPNRPWRIVLYATRDLRRWTFVRDLVRGEGAFAGLSWAGRPGLLHDRANGRWVLVFEAGARGRKWFRHQVGYASSATIDGAYRLESLAYPEPDRSTGDQSVYQEGDTGYLVTVLDSPGLAEPINRSLAIYRLTPDCLAVDRKIWEGFDATLPGATGSEAPHLVKLGPVYYWFVSGLVGWESSPTRYATAPSLAGPWSDLKPVRTDPATPDSYNTQHDFVLPLGADGGGPWLYVGDRYSQWTKRGTGRNIALPLRFEAGEPVLAWREVWEPA